MNTSIKLLAATFAFIVTGASAQVGQFIDTARVINVQPVMQTQDCVTPQQGMVSNERSNTGGVIGGLAGALLGSQVGGGNGRIAAAALGGVVGALTGDRVDNRGSVQQLTYSNCNRQVSGYLVTFDYNGRQGQKRMSYDPGQTIRVVVSVDPQ